MPGTKNPSRGLSSSLPASKQWPRDSPTYTPFLSSPGSCALCLSPVPKPRTWASFFSPPSQLRLVLRPRNPFLRPVLSIPAIPTAQALALWLVFQPTVSPLSSSSFMERAGKGSCFGPVEGKRPAGRSLVCLVTVILQVPVGNGAVTAPGSGPHSEPTVSAALSG